MADLKIPGYELLNCIGEGAMSRVYTARQHSLQRTVAIKVLRPEKAENPTMRAQFKLEANATAALKHPNILQVYEAGERDGFLYFVMEHAAAYSVESWVNRKGRLQEADVLTIADFTARTLQYAWDRSGLIHCDLKPGNLLVDEEGLIKVADFSGLSRFNTGPEAELLRNVTIGTPNYMSPEQVLGLTLLDCRADIYGLGALMHHLLTGEIPFGDQTPENAMRLQVEGYLHDISETHREVSLATILFVERLLVKSRDARYPSWNEVLADLSRIHSGRGTETPVPPSGASTMRRTTPLVRTTYPAPVPSQSPPPLHPDPLGLIPKRRRWLHAVRFAVLLGIASGFAIWDFQLLRERKNRRDAEVQPLRPDSPTLPVSQATGTVPAEPAPVAPPPPTAEAPAAEPDLAETLTLAEDLVAFEPVPDTPEPGTEETPDSAETSAALAFSGYLDLVRDLSGISRKRKWEEAAQTAESWHAANPGHPYAGAAQSHAALFKELTGLLPLLADPDSPLNGATVRLPQGGVAEVVGVDGGALLIRRKLDAGFAESRIETASLSAPDLLGLLKKADPAGYPRRAAVLLTVLGDAEGAAAAVAEGGASVDPNLPLWTKTWLDGILNQNARTALSDLRGLIVKSEFQNAARRMDSAKKLYGRSETFTRFARAEVAELEAVIAGELAAEAVAEQPVAPPPGVAESGPAPEIQNVGIREFNNRMAELDGKCVRLAFTSRGAIQSGSSGGFSSEVYSAEGRATVRFAEEGLRWMTGQPQWASVKGRERFVYGRVDASTQTLDCLGRSRREMLGGKGVQFSW